METRMEKYKTLRSSIKLDNQLEQLKTYILCQNAFHEYFMESNEAYRKLFNIDMFEKEENNG